MRIPPSTLEKMGLQHTDVETVMLRANGSMDNILWYRGIIGQVQKTLHSWWKKKIANHISKIDNFVKHVFREHNQEADLWTNSGAEGQRKIVVHKCSTSETWNAVKGCWDGSLKDSGKKWMRCGDQRCRQEQMRKLRECACSRESSIWCSTNVCVQSVHQRINQILIKQRASLQVGVESIRNTDKRSTWQLKPRSQCPSGDCTRHGNVR